MVFKETRFPRLLALLLPPISVAILPTIRCPAHLLLRAREIKHACRSQDWRCRLDLGLQLLQLRRVAFGMCLVVRLDVDQAGAHRSDGDLPPIGERDDRERRACLYRQRGVVGGLLLPVCESQRICLAHTLSFSAICLGCFQL